MSKRYKRQGEYAIDSVYGRHATLVADLLDTRTGTVFREGAWAVSTVTDGRKAGSRQRPFEGETAWMDAERLASDLAMQDLYQS